MTTCDYCGEDTRPIARRDPVPMCKRCWRRWRRHGDPTITLPRRRPRVYPPVCGIDGCDQPHHAGGLCQLHYGRVKSGRAPDDPGNPRVGRKRLRAPGYAAVHKRLMRDVGSPADMACVDCHGPARDWSYNGGAAVELTDTRSGCPYSADPADYSPRCVSCHRIHDGAGDASHFGRKTA